MKLTQEQQGELARLFTEATDDEQTDGLRGDLFDRYMGEPYGDEVAGRSKFIDTTVSDAVEAVLTDVLDIYTSQPRIAVFKPMGPEDKEAAQQETDVCHHVFWEKNNGFEILYTWFKEGLVQQNAYCWSGWVDKERVIVEEYEGLTIEEMMAVLSRFQGEDYEILEQEGFEEVQPEDENGEPIEDAEPVPMQTGPIAIKVRCVKKTKEYVIEPFPQEQFFCTPRWGKVALDGIPCCGRKQEKRKAELIAMGFDEESIDEAIGAEHEEQDDRRHSTRDSHEKEADDTDQITLYEAYVLMDLGKGESLYRVYAGDDNGTPLRWADGSECIDEVSHRRISCLTPMIVHHRHIGRSVAERVDDIQQVNTVLMRQLLDNLYGTNYARPYFDENAAGQYTYQDLQNVDHGAPVRTGGADMQWYTPPSVAPTVLPVLEKMSALKEERTGATRYNQGLDAESLNKTVGGMGMILNASQKKNKLIARTFAETGLRDLFLRMHADLRAGPWKQLAIELRGQWVQVSPWTWRDRTDMTVAIGMGKGDQDMKRQGHMALGQVQEKLLAAGSRMVGERELYSNIKDTAETFGIDHIDPYVIDPATIPPQPPQPQPPDPLMLNAQIEMQKVQAKAQADAQKMQQDHEYRMAQVALEREKLRQGDMKLQLQDEKQAADIQTDDEKLEIERRKLVMNAPR